MNRRWGWRRHHQRIFDTIEQLRGGRPSSLVEQNASSLKLADRGYVLEETAAWCYPIPVMHCWRTKRLAQRLSGQLNCAAGKRRAPPPAAAVKFSRA